MKTKPPVLIGILVIATRLAIAAIVVDFGIRAVQTGIQLSGAGLSSYGLRIEAGAALAAMMLAFGGFMMIGLGALYAAWGHRIRRERFGRWIDLHYTSPASGVTA